jgi:hypothetical protein
MAWPKDKVANLEAFYGKHKLNAQGTPTAAWLNAHLKSFKTPYTLTLSYDLSKQVKSIYCHKLVADSLLHIYEQILAHYGNFNEVKKARMHLFAGCYNYRIIKGSGRLSTHAWGAGIDIDSAKNPQGTAYNESKGMMPQAVVKIFKAEGWKWGGTFPGSKIDCMHFQATI